MCVLCKSCRSSTVVLHTSDPQWHATAVPLRMALQLLSLHQNRLRRTEAPWQQGQEGG